MIVLGTSLTMQLDKVQIRAPHGCVALLIDCQNWLQRRASKGALPQVAGVEMDDETTLLVCRFPLKEDVSLTD